jgi:hypothetical protein
VLVKMCNGPCFDAERATLPPLLEIAEKMARDSYFPVDLLSLLSYRCNHITSQRQTTL